MRRLIVMAVSALCLRAGERRATFEIRGEILPHEAAAVSLHAVTSPFATSTRAGLDGRFRFRKVEAGAYTITVSVPQHGETRMTLHIGPGTADSQGRLVVRVDTQGEALHRESGAIISARAWQIPARAQRAYEEANHKIAHRDYDGAIACLRRAVQIEPRFAAAWNHLGTIAYQTQHYPEAADYFRQGLAADPAAYEPLVNLGGVLLNLGNSEEARKYNLEAVRQRPNDALAQSQLGLAYLLLNQLEPAEKHLLRACQLDPGHFSHPQLHLAEVYVRRQEFRRAADQLEDFLQHHPDWPNAARMRQTIERWRQ